MTKPIAIIIPCYNEALRLQVAKFASFVRQYSNAHLWFVNDGSTDQTLSVLQQLADGDKEQIFVHHLLQNVGKAEAIRQAVLLLSTQNTYQYIGFIDADLSAPLEEIMPLVEIIIEKRLLIVAGARVKLVGKVIHRSAVRHYFGRVFATYQDTLLQLGNYDTQCGLKIFDNSILAKLFEEKFTSNWFFDIELFVRARILLGEKNYNCQVAEIPLNEWKEVKGSKLKLSDFIKAPFEVLKIYSKYKS